MVRCIMCKKVSRGYPGKCWRQWRLCGQCALRIHPESYPKRYSVKQSVHGMKMESVKGPQKKKMLDVINSS